MAFPSRTVDGSDVQAISHTAVAMTPAAPVTCEAPGPGFLFAACPVALSGYGA